MARGEKKVGSYTYKFNSSTGELEGRNFPTASSVGLSHVSSADKQIDAVLNDMIVFFASLGTLFDECSQLEKANMILVYIGGHYYYDGGSYDALSMISKGYGTCFAYSDLTYCFARKCGISNSWLTVPGKNVDHIIKYGNTTKSLMYGYNTQHRTVVALIDGMYYDLDANGAFNDLISGDGLITGAEPISESYAKYLLGKSNSYTHINEWN